MDYQRGDHERPIGTTLETMLSIEGSPVGFYSFLVNHFRTVETESGRFKSYLGAGVNKP